MDTMRKFLLVRADFVLDRSRGGSRLLFKQWRRALAGFFPKMLGCATRADRSVVRLHHGEEQGRFTGWLRLPVERLPGPQGLRGIKAKMRDRLEAALLAVGGDVLNFGVRRYRLKGSSPVEKPKVTVGEPSAA
jgi:hypothetical protein